MIHGIMAGQARPVSAGAVLWTPLNMAVVPQIYLDAQDSAVTDVSGACSAISNLGALGANGNFSQATAANRPTIVGAALNGKRVLSFDGVTDFLGCDSVSMRDLFRAKTGAWSFAVYKKRTADASPTSRVIANFTSATGATRFAHWCGSATAGKANTPHVTYNAASFKTVEGGVASSASYALSWVAVDLVTGVVDIYHNGSVSTSVAESTGAFPDTSASASFQSGVIGARGDLVWLPDMDLAAIVVGNVNPSAGERQRLEGWAAHKYGLTASLPGGHPYKATPPTV